MKIYMKIEDDTVKDIKFKTFGCGAAVATSSMATERWVRAKASTRRLLTNKAVMEALDGLPSAKSTAPCSLEEAIHAAIEDYYDRLGIKTDKVKKCSGCCSDCHVHEEKTKNTGKTLPVFFIYKCDFIRYNQNKKFIIKELSYV